MTKLDGSLSIDGELTPLMKLFLKRRSVRKYAPGSVSADQLLQIKQAAEGFQRRLGIEETFFRILGPEDGADQVRRAAMRGVIGKINPWLANTQAKHLMICGARYEAEHRNETVAARLEREKNIKLASMTMQIAILAATQQGLGTCWLAGIHHQAIEDAYAFPKGVHLIAISPLGIAVTRLGLSWDTMMLHLLSKRRKPLESLWMKENWRDQP